MPAEPPPNSRAVSRETVRAILEMRDRRHNETHAALVAMYQALVAELTEAKLIDPGALAQRLERAERSMADGAHGDAARDALRHVLDWIRALTPDLPVPHADRWEPPAPWRSDADPERSA